MDGDVENARATPATIDMSTAIKFGLSGKYLTDHLSSFRAHPEQMRDTLARIMQNIALIHGLFITCSMTLVAELVASSNQQLAGSANENFDGIPAMGGMPAILGMLLLSANFFGLQV